MIKSRERRLNEQARNDFLAFVEVLDWPSEAAPGYGEIRAALEAKG
jgi:predicted nucleic acid-binding protein